MRRHPRHAGRPAGRRRALRAGRRASSGMRAGRAARAPARACSERGLLRRVAAILFHRRAGFSANGMGVWQVPDERDRRGRPADGRLPRHLALLPAPDLRRLALLGLHDGPRALQGGVRRDPRRDRRRRPGSRSARRSTRSTEFKKIRLLYFTDDFKALGTRARGASDAVSLTDARSAELYAARAAASCPAASTRRCARCARSAATRSSSSAATAPRSSTSTATATSTTSARGGR